MPRDALAPLDPFVTDDVLSMTHQPEAVNPVPGIVKPAAEFLTSGDMAPVHLPGTEPKNYLRELVQNPDIMEKNIEQASNFAGIAGTTGPKPPRYMVTSPEGKKYILAYHGSPHDFEKFDSSKIGTGEGQQVFGRGLYFAENENVAKDYRDKLSGGARFAGDNEGNAILALKEANGDRPAAIKSLKEFAAQMRARNTASSKFVADSYERSAEMLEKGWEPPKGKMYQVGIKADPEHFLDWDKPLSEQHPKVKEALQEFLYPYKESMTGQQWIDQAHSYGRSAAGATEESAKERVAERLRQAGIPGIKYLDQGSRSADEGTRNYVVFDDKLIDIIKKYGWASLGLPALGAAGQGDKQ